jgi:predicted nucleic acid-binding Zn ribbon protein
MPIYNYKCNRGHITEIFCNFNDRPEFVQCEYFDEHTHCTEQAHRSFDSLAIYSGSIKGGTGGGVHMKQKGNNAKV